MAITLLLLGMAAGGWSFWRRIPHYPKQATLKISGSWFPGLAMMFAIASLLASCTPRFQAGAKGVQAPW